MEAPQENEGQSDDSDQDIPPVSTQPHEQSGYADIIMRDNPLADNYGMDSGAGNGETDGYCQRARGFKCHSDDDHIPASPMSSDRMYLIYHYCVYAGMIVLGFLLTYDFSISSLIQCLPALGATPRISCRYLLLRNVIWKNHSQGMSQPLRH